MHHGTREAFGRSPASPGSGSVRRVCPSDSFCRASRDPGKYKTGSFCSKCARGVDSVCFACTFRHPCMCFQQQHIYRARQLSLPCELCAFMPALKAYLWTTNRCGCHGAVHVNVRDAFRKGPEQCFRSCTVTFFAFAGERQSIHETGSKLMRENAQQGSFTLRGPSGCGCRRCTCPPAASSCWPPASQGSSSCSASSTSAAGQGWPRATLSAPGARPCSTAADVSNCAVGQSRREECNYSPHPCTVEASAGRLHATLPRSQHRSYLTVNIWSSDVTHAIFTATTSRNLQRSPVGQAVQVQADLLGHRLQAPLLDGFDRLFAQTSSVSVLDCVLTRMCLLCPA